MTTNSTVVNGNGHKKTDLDAETILKNAAKIPEQLEEKTTQNPPKQKATAIQKSSEAIANKTQEKVAALTEASAKKSKANRLTGIKEARKDLQEIKEAYHLELVSGLTELKLNTALELSEQLDLLSEFTDEQLGSETDEELEDLLTEGDFNSLDKLAEKLTKTLGKKDKGKSSGLNLLSGI